MCKLNVGTPVMLGIDEPLLAFDNNTHRINIVFQRESYPYIIVDMKLVGEKQLGQETYIT